MTPPDLPGLADPGLIVHLFVALTGPDAAERTERLERAWEALAGRLETVEKTVGRVRVLTAAGEPLRQAILRDEHDMRVLSLALTGSAWGDLARVWRDCAGDTRDWAVGECLLFVGYGSPPEADTIVDGVAVRETGDGGDDRSSRTFLLVAPRSLEAGLDAWAWTSGDDRLAPLPRHLLHAAKIRYQLRVYEDGRAIRAARRRVDEQADTLLTMLGGEVSASARLELTERQTAAAGLIWTLTRLREMRRTVEIARHNMRVTALADDLALADWFLLRLDDDLAYADASRERAREIAAVADGRRGPDPGASPVGVDHQEQPFEQLLRVEFATHTDRVEDGQAAGAQRGLSEHVHQRHHAPPGPDRSLEPPQVDRLGRRVQRGQLDRAGLAVGDLQPGQSSATERVIELGQFEVELVAQLVDEHARIEGLAEFGVVLEAAYLVVGGEVVVGVAPPVRPDHPDLLAAQLVAQALEHPALIHRPQDPLTALAVGPVHQLYQLRRHHAVDRNALAERVALDPVRLLGLVAFDQRQCVHHRRVHRVRRPELQRLDDLDQAGPVVVGVGGLEHPLLVLPVRRPFGLELVQQRHQRLVTARHRRIDHVLDPGLRCLQRGLGHLEQDGLLARHPLQLRHEIAGHLRVRAGVDPVHRRDQQVDEGVGDLAAAARQVSGQQRHLDVVRRPPQLAGCLGRHPRPQRRENPRRDVAE
ncbi:CATRA conflict system CASPASE/TPR repeat-associated protein [Herbidospora galbida]|uniref:CATRA conflict system CASPASE/TPR repeat-associated protein n=1 Tax=Herbidospora galbida TaxID=2575442 RepID=UPI003CCC7A1C